MKITKTVYQVDDVTGSPGLIVGDEYLTLIDAGVPECETKIFAAIESLGRKPADLKHILITHSDRDHIGALPEIVAATGAKVYGQRDEADVTEGKRKTRGGQMVAKPVKVDQIVKEGDVLPLHGGIRVVEAFGHTLGHVCYYLLSEKLLFTGDCMTNTNGLTGSLPQYTANPDLAKATVKKIAALAPDSLAFGHGPAIIGGAAAQLKALAETM
jgi:glyoxylase-like metal-dependent hydrolase (beta-lactamase superfamily II)